MTVANLQQAQRRLVDHVVENGALTPEWRPAFEAVQRAAFIPETVWVEGE